MGIQELIQTLQHIQSVPDKTKLNTIAHVLSKMDDNQDGSVRVEDVYDVSPLYRVLHTPRLTSAILTYSNRRLGSPSPGSQHFWPTWAAAGLRFG